MKIAIRADASPAMGSGHVMRCLCLADTLTRLGAEVSFICNQLPEHLAQLVRRNHALSVLPASRESGLEAPQQAWPRARQLEDAASVRALSAVAGMDWLVVDHYGLDRAWESAVRHPGLRILAIDDLSREHDCDVLLDQNLHHQPERRYMDRVASSTRLLLGPTWALLRPEFAAARATAAPRTGPVHRLHVFMGGMDAGNATSRVLSAVTHLQRPDIALDVVIGSAHPARRFIEEFCETRPGARCHVQTSEMASLLAAADLAVGAGGSATWERCATGVPAIALVLADNQAPLVQSAARHGLVYAPDTGAPDEQALAMHLGALIANTALREQMSRLAWAAVDGQGARRVAALICASQVTVRPATPEDADDILAWRNSPAVRASSRDSRPIGKQAHLDWFTRTLKAENRALLIGFQAGEPVGVLRFDMDGSEAEVSIYLLDTQLGKSLGPGLLQAGESWLVQHHPHIETVRAETLAGNRASQRLFDHCGYSRDAIRFSRRIQP